MSYTTRSSDCGDESQFRWKVRMEAVGWMAAMEIDVPLDPDELSRELEAAQEPGAMRIDSKRRDAGYFCTDRGMRTRRFSNATVGCTAG